MMDIAVFHGQMKHTANMKKIQLQGGANETQYQDCEIKITMRVIIGLGVTKKIKEYVTLEWSLSPINLHHVLDMMYFMGEEM